MEPEPKPGQTPEQPKQPETPATPPAVPELPDWVKDPTKAYEEIQKLRTEAAERRTALKALEDAKAKREADEAKANEAKLKEQSEFKALAETLQAERDKLKADIEALTLNGLRAKIAAEFQLPPAFAERLKGATEEELKADAEALKAALPAQPQTPGRPGGTTTPVPGGTPGKETDEQRRRRLLRGGGTQTFGGN
ncbi:MAG: hypothetical protein IT320_12155 [Anaerolineae bacterium]|nr:hypothetical protein [Anaerolineae bacterium]